MTGINFKQLRQDASVVLTGDFVARIVDATATTSQNGKPMIKCKWKIEAGQYAGRPLWSNFVISPESPGAMRMFFSHMSALGLGEAFFNQNPAIEQIAAQLEQKLATVTLTEKEWQGAKREEISGIAPAPGGAGGAGGGAVPTALPTAATPKPASTPAAPASSETVAESLGEQPTTQGPELPF